MISAETHEAGSGMSLLVNEHTVYDAGEILLSSGPLEVGCQITVEWLRGIPEPTWYGYVVPVDTDMRVMPGRYRLRFNDLNLDVLIRRPVNMGIELCFPFWGLGPAPDLPDQQVIPDSSISDAQ